MDADTLQADTLQKEVKKAEEHISESMQRLCNDISLIENTFLRESQKISAHINSVK